MDKVKLNNLLNKEISYPDNEDKELQYKVYNKREFYYYKIPENKKLDSYDEVKKFRDKICGSKFNLYTHQSLLANFINPETPYRGLLIFHGVGTGKTGTAISIAENFKDMVKKYNTKIHIVVPGPLLKENWKDEIIKFSGNKYIQEIQNKMEYLDEQEIKRAKSKALKEVLQYYKIITHRGFYRKVLGEKIRDIREMEGKKKYRKNEEGDIERDLANDRIENLDNTLLIIDEAHSFTGNEHGDALRKIIDKSKNLRLILMTATPMKNYADDIIELINFLRPINDKIKREHIFTSNKSHLMDLKTNWKDYFQRMSNGYISYYRGANPLLFAKKVEVGKIPKGLIFTKCIRCNMLDFQKETYLRILQNVDDALEKASGSVANFVFPGLSKNKKDIEGYFGENGINVIKSNLKTNKDDYLNKLNKKFFGGKIKNVEDIVYESSNTTNVTGLIYHKDNLKLFSAKFYKAFNNINDKIEGKKGAGTIFVYSNLVKVGIEVFQEILLQNGYLEFRDDQKYVINNDTLDYRTGLTYKDFRDKNIGREFYPATFLRVTGKNDEIEDEYQDSKKQIIDKYFNNIDNTDGKYLKIILGSRVMNEGVTLENTSEVHLLDVYYNFGRVEQVIGRAVRQCKHYNITSEKNPFPEVKIYKYVIALENSLSSEEDLYRKAEFKYITVKKIERAMKEVAIDCALNYGGNVFKEETAENKGCYKPDINEILPEGKKFCSDRCDFMECDYLCYNNKLNLKYYDKNSLIFKKIEKSKLDYTTFTDELAKNEINITKERIKELFRIKYVFTLREILNEIKKSYTGEQKELFEDYFVYQALNKLILDDESDFVNYIDIIYDKYNVQGYLIYRGYFYIFQPFDENEDVPMFYRENFNKELYNNLSLYSYLKTSLSTESKKIQNEIIQDYDFYTIKKYYENKNEFDIVGIIDKIYNQDVFKIRDKMNIKNVKKRGIGITTERGAVCFSSKNKKELLKITSKLDINKINHDLSRMDLCDEIKFKLYELEKYKNDNTTYLIVPYNHPNIPFPLNLKDRIKYFENNFNDIQNTKIYLKINKKIKDKLPYYELSFTFSKDKLNTNGIKLLNKYSFNNKNNKWFSIFE